MRETTEPRKNIRHPLLDRRRFLSCSGSIMASMGLSHLLQADGHLASSSKPSTLSTQPIRPIIDPAHPHAARPVHFPAKAQQILMIFCSGAVSHLDTFDYKPALWRHHGKPMPGADGLITFQGEQGNLARSPWAFRARGQSGKQTSDLLPHLGSLVDDLCFIHSLTSETNTHGPGENFMCTGFTLDGFPSIGAWTTYALGSEVDSLPAYVAIPDPRGAPQSSVNCWGPGFLPAAFQGTDFNANQPVRNLRPPADVAATSDRRTRDYLNHLNRYQLKTHPGDSELAARISSYELAARMQLSVPAVSDLSGEPRHILQTYGVDSPGTDTSTTNLKSAYARNCILARRLIEQGVRFVQLFNGAYQTGGEGVSNWDGHKTLEKQYQVHGQIMDQPTAALIQDLRQRGLLDHTLVVWCTEFGRMPTFQKGASGRDHNPRGFTAFLTGAGVQAPFSYGATDPFGYQAVENIATTHDFHATLLHLMGLDHERLSFYHNGIERRLTNVHGNVIGDILL